MNEKVLLVDDERDFLEALAERMRARGMQVATTTTPIEALQMTVRENYDAIVLDLLMPEMEGLELLKALKKKNPRARIILLTGYATRKKIAEAMKLGAVDMIEKPADLELLTKIIKKGDKS